MRVPVVSKEGKPLMPTTPARCRKMLHDGVARKQWSKEGIFHIRMLVSVGKEVQDIALAVDPGSKYDGYAVSGAEEIALLGMAVLPSIVRKRMETRRMLRRGRRRRNCRRRKARFNNRKKKIGWIAPSQLAKVQLRIRLMQRLCQLFPVTDIVIEDVKFDHYTKRWGKHFSTVELGKSKVYEAAEKLANLRKFRGWETAQARKDYGIKKCNEKSRLVPQSHANDAWAMLCCLYDKKLKNAIAEFHIWRRQECSRRQLHWLNPVSGGKRRNYGGTTSLTSNFRKGDMICYRRKAIGYVGGWGRNGKLVSLVGVNGKRVQQVGVGTVKLLKRSSNILVERRSRAIEISV